MVYMVDMQPKKLVPGPGKSPKQREISIKFYIVISIYGS